MVAALHTHVDAIAESWAPRERLSLPDWCVKNLRLPLTAGPNPRFDLDRFPYACGILEAAEDPETDEIIIETATQVGKTTILQAILAGSAVLDPAPAMLCAPDRDSLRKLRNKFYDLCDASPILRKRVPSKHKRNMSEIDFGTCVCHLAWTGNPQRVAAESCRRVLVTETDRSHHATHEGALHKLISERVKAWYNYLIIFEGTPTDETSVIDQLYQSSSRETFLVPCPHCGTYQLLRFFPHKEGDHAGNGGVAGMKNEAGDYLSADEVEESAWYACINGCRINSREKNAAVRLGRWCPAGCRIEPDGTMTGTPLRSKKQRGFGELSSLYSDTITIGRMAREYIKSRDKEAEFQNFLNNWCCLKYAPRTKTPSGYDLWRRLRSPFRRGVVSPQALFLTSGVDVQEDRAYWIVRAWGEGCTSWLVDCGQIPVVVDENGRVKLGSQLSPLRGRVIEATFPVAGVTHWGQEQLPVVKTAIDCGHQPAVVHDFVRQFHRDSVLTVAGDAKPRPGVKYDSSLVEKNVRTGKPYPGGMRRWAIHTEYYKQDIQGRWQAPLDEPGAWWLCDAPWDEVKTYMQQVTNEGRRATINKRGFTVFTWTVLRPGLGNHFWDCEIYARAAADMVVNGDWENLTERCRPPKKAKPSGGARPEEKESFIRKPTGGFIRRS